MDLHLLFPGSLIYVPGMVDAPTSSCVLLEGENKKILIDPGGFPSLNNLEERLAEFDLSPNDITDIALTHFHLDHAFNSVFFPCATIRLHESYSSKNYDSFGPIVGRMYRMVLDSWARVETFKDRDELFGSLRVLASPYHCRDHVSFLLDSANHGKVFICGDVCTRALHYHQMRKGLRDDAASAFVLKYFDLADTVIFSHDSPFFKNLEE